MCQVGYNLISKQNSHIWWTTSDGFKVIHETFKQKKVKSIQCLLPGSRKSTRILIYEFSDKIDILKMKLAISPNYVHSLDGDLLRRVALRMHKEGIVNSDWIHDSFGCHPNYVTKMLDITKEEYSNMMLQNPLKKLHIELVSQIEKTKRNLKLLKTIQIPYLNGYDIESPDKNIALDSEWFFS